MNALYILPLLLSASVASAAEPAAAASAPVPVVPAASAAIPNRPAASAPAPDAAAASTPTVNIPSANTTSQSAPVVSAPGPGTPAAAAPPVAPAGEAVKEKASKEKAAKEIAAKERAAERKANEAKTAERKARRNAHAKHSPPRREGETAEHKPGRKERIKRGGVQPPSVALDRREGRNPVLEAINLVATTQRAEIQAADDKVSQSDWWSDTLERDWIVKRPFGPGIFDSTHWFYVSYKVNGRILMSWFVDVSKGTVSDIAPPEKQNVR